MTNSKQYPNSNFQHAAQAPALRVTRTSLSLGPGFCNDTTHIEAGPNRFGSSDLRTSENGFVLEYCDLEFICNLGFKQLNSGVGKL